METNKISIAIDGPAAAGKSTVAKIVARELSYIYIDTGAMYRAITFKALEQAIPLNNEAEILNILKHTEINLSQGTEGQRVVIEESIERMKFVLKKLRITYLPLHDTASYMKS